MSFFAHEGILSSSSILYHILLKLLNTVLGADNTTQSPLATLLTIVHSGLGYFCCSHEVGCILFQFLRPHMD